MDKYFAKQGTGHFNSCTEIQGEIQGEIQSINQQKKNHS